MKRTLLILATILSFSVAAKAQVLLYQWAFTNSTDSFSNSAASYAITPGTGDLVMTNVTGDAIDATGVDGINAMAYFTNSNAGPGSGPGVNATGAFVANGQGYNGGSTAIARATNLNLGTLSQFTVTFWVKMDPSVFGQFPRFVQFYQTPAFDVGGKGSGNHNGVGASINGWIGGVGIQEQNGVANNSSGQQSTVVITNNPVGNPNLPNGFVPDSATWYFEAITYDGSATANNFTTWIGTSTTNIVPFVLTANYGPINFTTNATVMVGGNDVPGSPRGLSGGSIADVRIYSGLLTSNMLENVRNFQPDGIIAPGSTAATITSQPISGKSFVGGTRTFSVVAAGNPPAFTYRWLSNNVAVPGGTNSSLTVSNISASADSAAFVCLVTNFSGATPLGGTNSSPATLSVVTPKPGSYADAIYANHPYSFWLVNESSNSGPINISDYANGHDGQAVNPANNLFVSGPASPLNSGFDAHNTAIETLPNRHSELNMANPGDFPNTGMTICGWINTPVIANANGIIFDLVSDTAGGFGLTFGGGNQVSYQWGPANFFTSNLAVNTNEWTFIALVVSTNLTDADIANSIAADTNVTVYVGAHSSGLQSANDNTALNGSAIGSGTSASVLALGRTTVAFSENSPTPSAVNDVQFNGVAVFYSALPPQTITNIYLRGAGLLLTGTPDVNTVGNLLLTYPMGVLQESTNIAGPYNDVSGLPPSPYSVPITDKQHYYRVRN